MMKTKMTAQLKLKWLPAELFNERNLVKSTREVLMGSKKRR